MSDIDAAFEKALAGEAAAAAGEGPPPPPRRPDTVDADAPHGRDEKGEPLAPYGIGRNGKPRIKPGGPGRKPKADRPRTAPAPQAAAPATVTGKDFTADLDDFADGLWMAISGLPIPPPWRTRQHAQAAILRRNKPQLVKAANTAAQHHEGAAALIAKITSGSAAWILPVMFAAIPFVAQSAQMWRAPLGEIEQLAGRNMDEFREVLTAAMAAAQETEQEPQAEAA